MARSLRVNVAGGWYHVVSRGNGGERIYGNDTDRRRFLGLVSELPGRFSVEIHAFVLMDNHYHLLLRCREANLSDAIRWLQVSYAGRFNWAHRRRGHLFQGRFKSVLLLEERALGEVGRYIHLNPVRVGGLGLSKQDQRRSRVLGCEDPGEELVTRRVSLLREYPWSSWRMYVGSEPSSAWLCRERLQGGCGGRSLREQRRALREYTEAPIRQGHLESPWERLVGGLILGEVVEAQRVLKQVRSNLREQTPARRVVRSARPEWKTMIQALEEVTGRRWKEMAANYGDPGRDALLAVATRHLGWRLSEVVREIPGLSYNAAAQGVRRLWARAAREKETTAMISALQKRLSKI
ncbi:MAG: transposase [Verrucomicrobiales bacterium]|nr:transposase [Verrucomicrobiales bacterium]